jgi:hypothetical protein
MKIEILDEAKQDLISGFGHPEFVEGSVPPR